MKNNHPDPNVRGTAWIALANYMQQLLMFREMLSQPASVAQLKQGFGPDIVDYLKQFEIEKTNTEITALYETIVVDYADTKSLHVFTLTLGEVAKTSLCEIKFLSVGKPVPEVKGEDVDGQEFTLADYNGKVAMLDFWGDW